uniref:Uncharacterized protein n=1 Tax=Anguilla anguilla TaxID=7936 RepID=A0A0E9SFH2_ANGAN
MFIHCFFPFLCVCNRNFFCENLSTVGGNIST